jgi:ATP/maltotriose-dependent transcriptional regulator MalT
MATEVAGVVARKLRAARTQWVLVDDYHEISSESPAERFVEVINQQLDCRFLIASRLRPTWATARLAIYGDVAEIGRRELSMSREESRQVIGTRPDLEHVVAQAEGWPAVIGLAASARGVRIPDPQLSSSLLHTYFAEELFKTASQRIQRQLMQAALAPELDPTALKELFGEDAEAFREDATELGLVSSENGSPELHPLVRDFLCGQLAATPESSEMVTSAVRACVRRERWERAFELILRFGREDLIECVLGAAYMPLIRAGHTGTLGAFATKIRVAPEFPPAVVDLAEADIALADGAYELASRIAQRAVSRLGRGHELASRAEMIVAESAYAQAQLADAEAGYQRAHESARSEDDRVAALRGWALASLQGERPCPAWVMEHLEERRQQSPLDLVRHSILELASRHFATGFADAQSLISEGAAALQSVDDPRARSAFAHVSAYISAIGTNYRDAARWLALCDADIAAFDLDFARPYSLWNHAHIALGIRRFGEAERMLQKLEDAIHDQPLDYHLLNARILRARLALATGQVDAAAAALPPIKREVVIPSIHGEYLATRALALAIGRRSKEAASTAASASEVTNAVEVRVLLAAIKAVLSSSRNRTRLALSSWELADELGAWDPLVASIRASRVLADTLATSETVRPGLAALYQRTNDLGLARLGGLRARAIRDPSDILSPRELEVLGLIARGYRNQDIAAALVLSLSTVKVHVRHIFEKLGVRSRSEAVTRLTTLS